MFGARISGASSARFGVCREKVPERRNVMDEGSVLSWFRAVFSWVRTIHEITRIRREKLFRFVSFRGSSYLAR
jgi:hypothetical protein